MGYINTTFLGKEYSIPEDVLTYIDLLDFTDSVQKQLARAFIRKLRTEVQKGNTGLLGDEDLAAEIEQQVGKFIAKLCDNGIFTRTIRDYMNNKGYQYISDVNKAALEKIKSLLMRRIDSLQEGYEGAVQRAESHVTGMGFSIWSGSFVNHAIYAAMQASTINKQEKEASAAYQKEINALCTKLESDYDRETSQYINNEYIPNMEAALTVFAYELLDKYVADLIANGKFDSKTLDYIDIGRSNDLLKNLTLSNNKQAILENAFAACPYNIAVYMQAMKYDLLDYDSFQTTKVFKQEHHVLSFFRDSWGAVAFPTKFKINYHCVNMWALFTDKTPADLLRGLTDQYATGVVKAYSRIADILSDKARCIKIIGELDDDVVLSSDSICKGKACEYVEPIVSMGIWEQLTERCGHPHLLNQVKKYFQTENELHSKKDLDAYVIDQLTSAFEEARQVLVAQIEERRQEAERQQIERKHQRAIADEKRKVRNKKIKKYTVAAIVICAVALFIGVIWNNKKEAAILSDTKENIDLAASLLGREIEDTTVELSPIEYDFLTNDVYLLDVAGRFTHDYTETGNGVYVISVMRWESNQPISNFDAYFDFLTNQYGKGYSEYGYGEAEFDDAEVECAYLWKNIHGYESIGVWHTTGGIVSIGWTLDIALIDLPLTEAKEAEHLDSTYSSAVSMMEAGKYEEALSMFTSLEGYKDSEEKIKACNDAILDEKYNNAIMLLREGKYAEALSIFEYLDGYKESEQKITECNDAITNEKYTNAIALMNEGKYKDALILLEELGDYKDAADLKEEYAFLACEAGDVITFGNYEQDNNLDNGAESIEWVVLERDGNKALVISKYCIEWMPFHNTFTEVSWKNSSIRSWLNSTFLNSAFSAQEKNSIISTQNINPDCYDDSEDECNWLGTTTDEIFLLSSREANKYFWSDSARQTDGTEYACNKGDSASWYWWLRSANNIEYAGFVSEGELGHGEEVDRNMGIRPAMWIEISE